MNAWECPREADVLDAVASGRYPARDLEIAAHVAECAVCTDLAVVAAAMAQDDEAAWTDAAPPASELVWWRAQLRARSEAAQAAARPMAIVQGLAAVVAIAALVAVAMGMGGVMASAASGLSAGAAALVARVPLGLESASFVLRGSLLAIGIWIALIPVAVWLAADE
jgi:hypothetical protein